MNRRRIWRMVRGKLPIYGPVLVISKLFLRSTASFRVMAQLLRQERAWHGAAGGHWCSAAKDGPRPQGHPVLLDRALSIMSEHHLASVFVAFACFIIANRCLSWTTVMAVACLMPFSRNGFSMLAGNRVPVLLLRKFHHEQPPHYPVSRVMNRLVERGYQVVTLRDSVISGDRSTNAPASIALAGLAVLGACWIAVTYVLDPLGRFAQEILAWMNTHIRISVPLQLLALLAVAVPGSIVVGTLIERQYHAWKEPALRSFMALIRILSLSPFEKGHLVNGRALRRRGQLAMTVYSAADETWLQDVASLMSRCPVVVVDLSSPSANIELEVAELARRQSTCLPIWIRATGTRSQISIGAGQYTVLAQTFEGHPVEITYPATAPKHHDWRFAYSTFESTADNVTYLAAFLFAHSIEAEMARWAAKRKAPET